MKIESKKLRDSARGEQCTLNIYGVCNGNPETVILAHLPDPESNGMGMKPDDISSCYACHACHDAIDRRTLESLEEREWYMRRAMIRTWRRLFEKGVMKIEGVKTRPPGW